MPSSTIDLSRTHMHRRGISLIELLVVLAVIGVLMALLMPAVSWARESARRMQCSSHLHQIGLAIGNYESTYGVYPHGLTARVSLLPYIDQSALSQSDGTLTRAKVIPVYLCPSDPAIREFPGGAATNYPTCYGSGNVLHGMNGMFNVWIGTNGPIRPADVVDGLSNTVAVSEFLHADHSWHRLRVKWALPLDHYQTDAEFDAFVSYCESIPVDPFSLGYRGINIDLGLPWTDGNPGIGQYNHAMPPNRPSCGSRQGFYRGSFYTASSYHAGGVNTLMGDGRVQFVSENLDLSVWREMGSRTKTVPIQ